jgi:hypothetical protein
MTLEVKASVWRLVSLQQDLGVDFRVEDADYDTTQIEVPDADYRYVTDELDALGIEWRLV